MNQIFLAFVLSQATPIIELPVEMTAPRTGFVILTAKTTCKTVRWRILDDGPSMLPPEMLKDSKTLCLFVDKPGRYRVLAMTAKSEDEIGDALMTLTVLGPGPAPPEPPPAPPSPPKPPQPTDPFVARLQAAYDADPAPMADKSTHRARLSGLYIAMAQHCDEPTITTTAQLKADLVKTAAKLALPDMLVQVRKVIAAEVASCLDASPGASLTTESRGAAKACFTRISASLDALK